MRGSLILFISNLSLQLYTIRELYTMRFFTAATSFLALGHGMAYADFDYTERAGVNIENLMTVDDFQALAIKTLQEAETRQDGSGCTLANARVRRDW